MEFLVILVLLFVCAPIAKAFANRLGGGAAPDAHTAGVLRSELEDTEGRLMDTEQRLADTIERVAEVEERLDFAERLLAQERERKRLES